MSLTLGIFDADLEYSSGLMNYIKRKHKNIRKVRIFTNKTILCDFLLDNEINVLLISEDKLQEDINSDNIKNICILSEGNYISEGDNDFKESVYKYQSVEQIIMELFDYYPELNKKGNTFYNNNSKIISTFSLNGNFGRDAFSLNLANQYAADKKTLLIDLNLLHSSYYIKNISTDKNLSEFLYFLKSRTSNIILKMKNQLQSIGNFDYLKGVIFGPDLYDLTSSDLDFWIKELGSTDYDVVIFNVGCYTISILDLFRKSNEVFLVNEKSQWYQGLYDNFKEQLTWTDYQDVLNRISEVNINNELTYTANEYQVVNIFSDKWGELAKGYARDIARY